MMHNKTFQNQVRTGLEKNELELLSAMFDRAPVFMALTGGPNHRVQYLNPAFRRLLGDRSFPLGAPAAEILTELKAEDEEEIRDTLQRFDHAYETGEPFIANEFKVNMDITGDGQLEKYYFNWLYQPLKGEGGDVFGLFVVGYEVTQHVKDRQEKELGEQRLKLALEGAKVGFWEIDIKTSEMKFMSDECKIHYGFKAGDDPGTPDLMKVVHPEDRAYLDDEFKKAIEKAKRYSVEYRVCRSDDSVHWLLSRGQCLYDEEGQPYRFIGITEDITRQKEAERTLKEAVALRDDFLSIAAHELQTPVTSMKIQAELFEHKLRKEVSGDWADEAGKISRQVDHLARLMHKLLDMSRMHQEGLTLDKEPFSLEELIEEKVRMLGHVSHYSIKIEGQLPGPVYADPSRIGQVLINLIENAIKYSPGGNRVQIRYGVEAGKVVVSVIDFGIGIPREDRVRIFERFYKGKSSVSRTYPGFGIGLYVARQIIERHDGEIWVEDNPEGGSVFSFSLPYNESERS